MGYDCSMGAVPLIQAEEIGVTRDNLHSTIPEKNLRVLRMLRGEQGKVAKAMGVRT